MECLTGITEGGSEGSRRADAENEGRKNEQTLEESAEVAMDHGAVSRCIENPQGTSQRDAQDIETSLSVPI